MLLWCVGNPGTGDNTSVTQRFSCRTHKLGNLQRFKWIVKLFTCIQQQSVGEMKTALLLHYHWLQMRNNQIPIMRKETPIPIYPTKFMYYSVSGRWNCTELKFPRRRNTILYTIY